MKRFAVGLVIALCALAAITGVLAPSSRASDYYKQTAEQNVYESWNNWCGKGWARCQRRKSVLRSTAADYSGDNWNVAYCWVDSNFVGTDLKQWCVYLRVNRGVIAHFVAPSDPRRNGGRVLNSN